MSLVLKELVSNVCVLTINRPDALNSLNEDLLKAIDDAFKDAEKDDDAYVIVVTGAGKAFVAGADIAQMSTMKPIKAKEFGEFGNRVFSNIENCEKPVIAAVNGFALGGGCELILSCDIRIASSKAKFGQPEVGLGITPGFGGTQRLPRLISPSKAKELIFTGEIINSEKALDIGLVDYVVDGDTLIDEAIKLAQKIANNAQIAVRQSKKAINNGLQTDIKTGLSFESQAFALCFSTEDQKEAMTCFVNKEKINKFKNR